MKYHENQNMSTFFIRKWDPQVKLEIYNRLCFFIYFLNFGDYRVFKSQKMNRLFDNILTEKMITRVFATSTILGGVSVVVMGFKVVFTIDLLLN